MKRMILVVSVFLFLTGGKVYSQRAYHFGLHFSPNISWLKPEVEGEDYKSRGTPVKISYGAVFEYDFTPNIGIVTGLNILGTGGKLEFRHIQYIEVNSIKVLDTGVLSRKYNLQYIEIPLILKGSTGELLGNFSFFGKFGIGSGFNIKARANDEFLPDNTADGVSYPFKNVNINKEVSFFRESMIIGIGAEYKLGKTAIVQMGLTFSNGFTDVLTGKNTYTPDAKEKARSNFFELNIGVMF